MDLPKRAHTVRWAEGILNIDGTKDFEVPELDSQLMERLAEYKLAGLYISGADITDEMLKPFIGHKSMVNFGVEYGSVSDACFEIAATMPKLRLLLLDGNKAVTGKGISVLKEQKLELISLNHTSLNDAALLEAASIPKLSHVQLDGTLVTFEGLMATAAYKNFIPVSRELFSQEQMEEFITKQRQLAKKKPAAVLDQEAADQCRVVLTDFFKEMTTWEKFIHCVGFDNSKVQPRLDAIWAKYVSEKPRKGFRPLALSYSHNGTYSADTFIDAEQVTRNKIYIYTKDGNTSFERRFTMKLVDGKWKIDALHERLDTWRRGGL